MIDHECFEWKWQPGFNPIRLFRVKTAYLICRVKIGKLSIASVNFFGELRGGPEVPLYEV